MSERVAADVTQLWLADSPTRVAADVTQLWLADSPTRVAADVTQLWVSESDAPLQVAGDAIQVWETYEVALPLPDPNLRVSGITDSGALLSIDEVTDRLEVQFQTSLATDPTFSSPVDDVSSLTATRFYRTVSGRDPATPHITRVRYRTAAGWSLYFGPREWTTLAEGADPPTVPITINWLAPGYGEPVSGDAVSVQVALPPGVTITLAEIRLGDSGAWTSLGTNPGNPFTFDSTSFADSASVSGLYIIRITLSDGSSREHPGFRIDNSASVAYWEGDVPQPSNLAGWGTIGDVNAPGDPGGFGGFAGQWSAPSGRIRNQSPSIEGNLTSGLVRNDLTPAVADEMRVTGGMRLHTWGEGIEIVGGGRLAGVEGAAGGLVACGRGTLDAGNFHGVVLDVGAYLMSGAWGIYTCEEVGLAGDGVFGLRVFQAGDVVASAQVSIQVWASFAGLLLNAPGANTGARCTRFHDYRFLVEVRKPDRINFPNRIDVLGRVFGGVAALTIADTFDLDAPLLCGYGGYSSNRIAAAGSRGFRTYGPLGIDYFETDDCDTPPTETPDPPGIDVDVVCDDVTLSLFPAQLEPDPIAVAWEIAEAYDTEYSYPVYGPGSQSVFIREVEVQDLPPGDYIARATLTYAVGDPVVTQSAPFSIEENTPPTAPFWIQPSPLEVFTGVSVVPYEFGPAFDLEDDSLTYQVGYSFDGGQTVVIIADLGEVEPHTEYEWDITGLGFRQAQLLVRAWDGCQFGPWAIVCIEIAAPPCEPTLVYPTTVRRVERWSNVSGIEGHAGIGPFGIREAFLAEWLDQGIEDHRTKDGEHRVVIRAPFLTPANLACGFFYGLDVRKVVRLVYSHFQYEEMRVTRWVARRQADGGGVAEIHLEAIAYDLLASEVRKTQINGDVDLQFPLYRVSPANQLREQMKEAPPWLVAGTAAASTPLDMDYDFDSVDSASRRTAELVGLEREVLRACGLYRVDLVSYVGARHEGPVAAFTSYDNGDGTAFLDAAGSVARFGALASWTWDFGDGLTGSGESLVHAFATAGIYEVTLVVADAEGHSAVVTQSVSVTGP